MDILFSLFLGTPVWMWVAFSGHFPGSEAMAFNQNTGPNAPLHAKKGAFPMP